MSFEHDAHTVLYRIADESHGPVLDVFGPTIEFLSRPSLEDNSLCVIRGVVPAGATVPLHSHEDAEDFYIVKGTQQVLTQGPDGLAWADVRAGDYVRVPAGTMHAHRNVSAHPAVDLIVTTGKLGRFFAEVGRPFSGTPQPPTLQDAEQFVATCVKYGYVLGTPEENAAFGIETPKFATQ
jgi:quercetin dioxygenase-like cupin family protein